MKRLKFLTTLVCLNKKTETADEEVKEEVRKKRTRERGDIENILTIRSLIKEGDIIPEELKDYYCKIDYLSKQVSPEKLENAIKNAEEEEEDDDIDTKSL